MFSKKKTLLEQASDLAQDVADAIAPHLDSAREQLAPRLADARDKAGPALAAARDQAGPMLLDARDKAAPHIADARDRFVNDVVPAVQAAAATAAVQAGPMAEEARRRGKEAALKLKGQQPEPKHGKKKWLLLAGLAGIAALVAKKLTGHDEAPAWQSSYTPAAPGPRLADTTATTSTVGATDLDDSGGHRGDVPVDSPSSAGDTFDDGVPDHAAGEADAGGGTPGEALSDAGEAPQPVTTPDAPAETIDLGKVDTPSATPYGDGSALPNADGSAPEGFDIKGNKDSMKFHAPTSPWYDRTKAEVWFASHESAEAAGFVNAEKHD